VQLSLTLLYLFFEVDNLQVLVHSVFFLIQN
jgi:hypothetical protein